MRILLIVGLLAGCAAPPLGLGMGAQRMPGTGGVFAGATGYGAANERQSFQAEASAALVPRRWFAIEAGGVYTQTSIEHGPRKLFVAGGFPYLRPRFMIGPVSAAFAVSGFGIGGGEAGFVGGIADAQLGYGADRWSVYAGAYALYWDVTGGGHTDASQLRIGGEYTVTARAARLGISFELYRQRDSIAGAGPGGGRTTALDSTLIGAAIKLRIDHRELE